MFTFPIVAVRKVIDRGKADAAINGVFRNPYYGMNRARASFPGPGSLETRASTSRRTESSPMASRRSSSIPTSAIRSAIRLVSLQASPFRGDDGIEFVDAEQLIAMFDRNLRCTHLHVQLTERQVSLSLIVR